ncbi:MAG: hypothetical protein HOM14_02115 [Gammaproteobacteria bacterium]|jgi:hypothetical protein|nr:hypothetical protein [Gammaproteobacteria bacterium]MBT3724688.1 hypothetical protein [Gammaproteobacteria bacterium]MBT4192793.1 hypothetical protein [Gammaproteobacteria bacterium]MBT4448714.1 hypothetical protein [Gammaproteobacteria bacterium]MBT4862598.1 hypothetical protein [Gammaproteobacteria bacterium]
MPVLVKVVIWAFRNSLYENFERITGIKFTDKRRIVSDTSLSNHIKSTRKVLEEDGQKQQVIKTIHGRAYQFIANIEEVAGRSETLQAPGTKADNKSEKSIAVLAFADLSPEQDQEYFSYGLSEEFINLLAKIPTLRVISRTSSFYFKSTKATSEKISKQLNVTHILEGSVLIFQSIWCLIRNELPG